MKIETKEEGNGRNKSSGGRAWERESEDFCGEAYVSGCLNSGLTFLDPPRN
jgi:hypothetical protein